MGPRRPVGKKWCCIYSHLQQLKMVVALLCCWAFVPPLYISQGRIWRWGPFVHSISTTGHIITSDYKHEIQQKSSSLAITILRWRRLRSFLVPLRWTAVTPAIPRPLLPHERAEAGNSAVVSPPVWMRSGLSTSSFYMCREHRCQYVRITYVILFGNQEQCF